LASRQGFGELKTEQLGGHSQEQQRHRQAPIDDDELHMTSYTLHVGYVLYFEIQTMKTFVVPERTFNGHSRYSAMSFVRSTRLSIRDRKSRLHLCSDKIAKMISINIGDGTIQ